MLKRRARVLFACRDGAVLAPLAVACVRAEAADWIEPCAVALEPSGVRARVRVRTVTTELGVDAEPACALADIDPVWADLIVTLDDAACAVAQRRPVATQQRHRPFDPPARDATPDAYRDLRARLCAEIDAIAAGLRLLSRMDDEC